MECLRQKGGQLSACCRTLRSDRLRAVLAFVPLCWTGRRWRREAGSPPLRAQRTQSPCLGPKVSRMPPPMVQTVLNGHSLACFQLSLWVERVCNSSGSTGSFWSQPNATTFSAKHPSCPVPCTTPFWGGRGALWLSSFCSTDLARLAATAKVILRPDATQDAGIQVDRMSLPSIRAEMHVPSRCPSTKLMALPQPVWFYGACVLRTLLFLPVAATGAVCVGKAHTARRRTAGSTTNDHIPEAFTCEHEQ